MTVVARFTWDSGPLMRQVEATLEQRMAVATGVLSAAVKKKIAKGGGKPHIPSQPGEPPRRDTGGLISNVSHYVEVKEGEVVGYVSVDHPAARALELGYIPGGLEPRPYLRPTTLEMSPTIMKIIGGGRG